MKINDHLTIGSRGSRLALWQAEWVQQKLVALRPQLTVHIEIIKTTGDQLKNAPLSVIGGRGVFTKELEEALLDERIDIAVHSLKDLPTILPQGLAITAITEREDARDALILRADLSAGSLSSSGATLRALPTGASVGTSSLRRLAQLKHLRADFNILDLRGNVDTRLRKLDEGEYDAIVLAAAGLNRLGFADRISALLEPEEMLSAIGQGALGIETRARDHATNNVVALLDDAMTRYACTAERALLRALGGGCQLPIAGHAVVHEGKLRLDGLVAAPMGDLILRDRLEGPIAEAVRVGEELAARLHAAGAARLLAEMAT